MTSTTILKFPSGRTVKRLRQDAKALARQERIPLHKALDEIAIRNGGSGNWHRTLESLGRQGVEPPRVEMPVKTNMNSHRKLLVLGLNEILSRGLLSLEWDGQSDEPTSHIETTLAGHNAIIAWSGAGFGEVRVSVWWKYDHDRHPQANLQGNFRERFSCASPLAKRQHFPRFVGVVCSAWLERKEGKYLQGKGNDHLLELYTRRGELSQLKAMPNPTPDGYAHEGRFHM